jgi:hypothetical protein
MVWLHGLVFGGFFLGKIKEKVAQDFLALFVVVEPS